MSGFDPAEMSDNDLRHSIDVAAQQKHPTLAEPTHRLQGLSTDRTFGTPTLLVVGPRRRLIEVPLTEADLLDLIAGAAEQLRRLGRG